MDDHERAQIELILVHQVDVTRRALQEQLAAVYGNHAATGALRSGATIKVAVRTMAQLAGETLPQLAEKVRAVAADKDSFQLFAAAIGEVLGAFEGEMPKVIKMATGRAPEEGQAIRGAAADLFNQMRADVESNLEITAFTFNQPRPALASIETTPHPLPRANKGGRPLAQHWDDMWAAMAVALYSGDLNPKTQADVERAMLDWMSGAGHDVSESSIKGRARRLWDRLSGAAD